MQIKLFKLFIFCCVIFSMMSFMNISDVNTSTNEVEEMVMDVEDLDMGVRKIRYKRCTCNASASVGPGGVSGAICNGNKTVCRRTGGAECGADTKVGWCDCSNCAQQ